MRDNIDIRIMEKNMDTDTLDGVYIGVIVGKKGMYHKRMIGIVFHVQPTTSNLLRRPGS